MNSAVVIPAYKPQPALLDIVKDLISQGAPRVIVVDDGSGGSYQSIFSELSRWENCTVLTHDVNRGKGRALKTAFAYFLAHFQPLEGVVTADADGQHTVADILKVAAALAQKKDAIILGSRDFSDPQVPRRSWLGNTVTSRIFQLLYGRYIKDTQTGLRGVPTEQLPWLANLGGERFEYETNMLVEAKRRRVPICEVDIRTIYIEENKASHYSSLRDSLRIFPYLLSVFIQYALSSSVSAVIDIGTFILLNSIVLQDMVAAQRLLIATVAARILSSTVNFFINHNMVFRCGNDLSNCAVKYYTLWFLQLCASYGLIYLASRNFTINVPLMKAAIDICLVSISYQIQLHWVFRDKNPA